MNILSTQPGAAALLLHNADFNSTPQYRISATEEQTCRGVFVRDALTSQGPGPIDRMGTHQAAGLEQGPVVQLDKLGKQAS